jgi:hypothetical protein
VALGRNRRLDKRAQRLMGKARMRAKASGETEHVYGETRYAAAKWKRKRPVIIKAEVVCHLGRPSHVLGVLFSMHTAAVMRQMRNSVARLGTRYQLFFGSDPLDGRRASSTAAIRFSVPAAPAGLRCAGLGA